MNSILSTIMILLASILPVEKLLHVFSGKKAYEYFPPPLYYNSGSGGGQAQE